MSKNKVKKLKLRSPYDIEETLNNMKETRLKAGLTQDDLAEMLNVERGYISKWENRLANPSFDNLVRLYRILHGTV